MKKIFLVFSLLIFTLGCHAADEQAVALLSAAEEGQASQGPGLWSVGPAVFFDPNSPEAQEREALVRDYMREGGVEDESLRDTVDEAIDIWRQIHPGKALTDDVRELAENALIYKNNYKEAMKQQSEQLWALDLGQGTREIKGYVTLGANCFVTALFTTVALKIITS